VNAIEATGLGLRYGRAWALRNCSLRVPAGSIVALVGPNGAGKSTLMNLTVGMMSPTEGSITVFGEQPGRTAGSLARVGFLAQDHPLYSSFTVGELLHLGRAMNPRWDQELAARHLAALDIPLQRRAGKLSGGQRAQVALALALAKRADLLVLDEPVASLDPLARQGFMAALLTDAADHGTTVVLSSHVIAELDRVCDYLISLTGGLVQLDGPIDWLLERHRVLTGPRVQDGHVPAGVQRLLSRADTDRQTTLLVELAEPVLDPAWQQSPVGLEELVLAYMQHPSVALRHWPEGARRTGASR
jgi:ABC-2 type transport system ATP-binding protein